MELLLFALGLMASLAIAVYEHRRASRAETRLKEVLEDLPSKLIDGLSSLIASTPGRGGVDHPNQSLSARYADLNGDGRDEFLVEYVSGPHSTTLQAYGFRRGKHQFGKLGELSQSTPLGFELEDVDNDGALEVIAVEVAQEPGLPFVFGLRDRVTYKLGGRGFKEIRRVKCYTEEELQMALEQVANEGNLEDA